MTAILLHGCGVAPAPARHLGPVTGLTVAADGALVASSQGGVFVGDPDHWRALGGIRQRPFDVASLPDGRIVVAGGQPGSSGFVLLHDRRGALAEHRFGNDVVYCVATPPAANVAVLAGADGSVWQWDLHTPGTPPAELAAHRHAGACLAVAFGADGALATAGADGRVLLQERPGSAPLALSGHLTAVQCLVFLPDGSLAGGARDGRVRLHARDGRLLRSWQRLRGAVTALVTTANGLVAGTDDGRLLRLRFDDDAAEEMQPAGSPVHSLAAKGDTLLVGLNGTVATIAQR
jgi:WD40 repeat protein